MKKSSTLTTSGLAAKGVDVEMSAAAGKYNWMKVVDVMTRDPLTLSPAETVGQADEVMNQSKIRQIPIVLNKELVGIVTDRDVRSFLSGSLLADARDRERALNTPIQEIMTPEPVTISPEDDLQDALELLIEEKMGGIPVVDDTEGLVGIITYVDMLRCFLNRLQED
jgi:CBS domain-containing protein